MTDNRMYTEKDNHKNRTIHHMLKRCFDITFSAVILILISPILLIVSIWIMIDDGFPIFYKQKRCGIHNRVFLMYKFRSMKNKQVPVQSNSHDNYAWENGVPDEFVFKTAAEDNPNITQVGRFIRKYSLDELPQFINVFKGDMSVIGPRPEILSISRHYNKHQLKRLAVTPGITGWAQVNGRSNMNHGEKIRHDLFYVEHFSIWLDIRIFLKTIYQVVLGKESV